MEPAGERRRGRPVNTWKDGIRDRMQRRNLKEIYICVCVCVCVQSFGLFMNTGSKSMRDLIEMSAGGFHTFAGVFMSL
jgi:hypothetical protein